LPELEPWRTISSRHVVRDRWLRLRADTCRTPEGELVEPYYVQEYPDWVHLVCFNGRNEVLLTRQYRHGCGYVSLELPCGTCDPSDASPLDTARRELLEETGYTSDRFEHLHTVSPNPASHANSAHGFVAFDVYKAAEPVDDPIERIEHEFVPIAELLGLIDSGGFRHGLHVSAVYLALQRAGFLKIDPPS